MLGSGRLGWYVATVQVQQAGLPRQFEGAAGRWPEEPKDGPLWGDAAWIASPLAVG